MIRGLDELDREHAIAAMRTLEVELFGNHAWSETSVRQELTAPGRVYVFDVAGGSPDAVGVAQSPAESSAEASPAPIVRGFAGYWYDGEDAEIMDVGVGRAYQRQGIAKALMGELIARAKAQGARRMLLEVSVVNEPAIALYRGFGFERIGLRKRYYQPEGIDAYVMALDLAPRVVGFQSAVGTASDADVADGGHVNRGSNHDGEHDGDKEQERQS